jgi:hypothetical protein
MAFGNGPRIVTNGLVFALDAADQNSYVSGSTTWRSLLATYSGNLFQSCSFATGSPAAFVNNITSYQSQSAYLTVTPTLTFNDLDTYTLDFWVKMRSGVEATFQSLVGRSSSNPWLPIRVYASDGSSWAPSFREAGLGTYNEVKMEKGKMLNDFNYKNKNHYLEKLHEDSPYILPETTGYDINYNKFLKHGIELRIFDYFPEEYLEDILNLIILVCAHSSFNKIPDPKENKLWKDFVIDVLKHGSNAIVSHELNDLVKTIFDTFTPNIFHFLQNTSCPLIYILLLACYFLRKIFSNNRHSSANTKCLGRYSYDRTKLISLVFVFIDHFQYVIN